MNSRERVDKVLAHEIPDRLPNCWGGCETSGLHIKAYDKLVSVLGLPKRPVRVDTFMFNAVMDDDVLRAMDGDMLLIASPGMCARPLRSPEGWNEHDLFGIRAVMTDNYSIEREPDGRMYLLNNGVRGQVCPKGGSFFDNLPGDIFDDGEVPDPSGYHPRHAFSDEKLRGLEKIAKEAYETTDYSLVLGETLTDLQLMPGGMIAWYEAMINDPDIVGEYLEKATDAAMDQLVALDQAVGKYCSVLCIAHDLGDQRGVTVGSELFRKIYKPHYKRYFEGWHKRTSMKVNLHSCGAVSDIIPDLAECGVDILNPVQISANGMSPERVRALAGDMILYGGAFDSQQTPPSVDPEYVYEQVKKNIAALAANGNYLFAGVHNTAPDTTEEQLAAIIRAYRDMSGMYAK